MPPKKASKPEATAATSRPKRASAGVPEPASTPKPATASTNGTKKRGRPSKAAADDAGPPKKRGRPAKADGTTTTSKVSKPAAAKKVGRPTKAKPAVPTKTDKAPPKARGRPPKGGETTKISRDDDAAAEQLEEELVEAVEEEEEEGGAGAAPGKQSSTRADVTTESAKEEPQSAGHDQQKDDDKGASGRRFFLMKAEQEDRFETLKSGRQFNTKFTIDDLRGKDEPEMWDGVRNLLARNVMKEMKKGDLAFFYASGGKAGRKPGITGIIEVVREAEPDPTTHDEDAIGYVEKESDRDKWVIVRVEYRKKLRNPVNLKTLQDHAKEGGKLANLHVLNAARLSVSRVSPDEWNFIVDELIAGDYEDERGSTVS